MGRFLGKGKGQYLLRLKPVFPEPIGGPADQHPGFAGPGAGDLAPASLVPDLARRLCAAYAAAAGAGPFPARHPAFALGVRATWAGRAAAAFVAGRSVGGGVARFSRSACRPLRAAGSPVHRAGHLRLSALFRHRRVRLCAAVPVQRAASAVLAVPTLAVFAR